MKILAIESSCDETAAAVVESSSAFGGKILSNVISSQIEIHAQYGGVVPEVAARSHIEVIIPVIEQALGDAGCDWDDIDAIATTKGPGLIGSLLIGVLTAKTLAETKNKPLIGVNHIFAHGFAAFLTDNQPNFPFLALTVSGGHTTLSLYKQDLSREIIGETLDDAAGEAFDKVAKLLGLTYPGGPAIGKAAENGDPNKYKFPVAKLGHDSLDFSFSGLKTAVLRQVQSITGFNPGSNDLKKTYELSSQDVADIAASFQRAVISSLLANTLKANLRFKPKGIVVGGGVACNTELRNEMLKVLPNAIFVPPVLCTDNAAMIGSLALQMAKNDMYTPVASLSADSSLETI
ncbi:MAG: tRNA (adenosine(37)-N6)-threonylcarbamoyltransferase complex transferase subunit TsaD [Candidatus Saccharibacteria bacterium]